MLARFIPIIRRFAGFSTMLCATFLACNVFGGMLWVVLLVLAG